MTRKDKIVLAVILLSVLIKDLVWMNIIPPFQTPDEFPHFAYVQYVAEQKSIPIIKEKGDGFSLEEGLFHEALKTGAIARREAKFDRNVYESLKTEKQPLESRKSSGSNSLSGYPPAYYLMASVFYKFGDSLSIFYRFNFVRFFSVLLSLVAVAFAFLIGKQFNRESNLIPVTLAIFIGFNPMFSMTSIAVNNDILMDTISIILLYWLIRNIKHETRLSLILGGILLGIGMLTKAHMLYVTVFVLAVLLIANIYNKRNWKDIIKSFSWIGLPFVALYSGWAIFSFKHYHSFLGSMGFQTIQPGIPHVSTYMNSHFVGKEGLETMQILWGKFFWGTFGWLDTIFSSVWLYKALDLIVLISVVGVIYGVIKKQEHWKISLAALVFAFGNLVFLHAVEISYYMMYNNTMLQGRYLFTALVPISIVIIMGLRYLVPGNMRNYILVSLSTGMIIFNLASIDLLYHRYF